MLAQDVPRQHRTKLFVLAYGTVLRNYLTLQISVFIVYFEALELLGVPAQMVLPVEGVIGRPVLMGRGPLAGELFSGDLPLAELGQRDRVNCLFSVIR